MHYSQKKRYYFFIAILKFKTILSYYPPLAQASHTHFGKLSEFAKVNRPPNAYPSLNLRSTFAQGSLKVRSRFAQPSLMIAPHLRHTCATHFGKLSEFAKVNQLRQLADFPSSHTRLCQLADFPSLILRSRFAQGSLKVRPRWRKLPPLLILRL